MTRQQTILAYNLATADERHLSAAAADRAIANEIHALLTAERPVVLGLQECIGHRLPHVAGYTLVRDTSRPSRANVAAYVAHGIRFRHRWHDMHHTWANTEHPGTHPPRSFLELDCDGPGCPDQVLVVHHPPVTRKGPHDSTAARAEMTAAVVQVVAPWSRSKAHAAGHALARTKRRSSAAIGDWNMSAGALAQAVAHPVGGSQRGIKIDSAVTRRLTGAHVDYIRKVGHLDLGSDHGHAARLRYDAPSRT